MLVTSVQPETDIAFVDFSGSLDTEDMIECRKTLEAVAHQCGSLRLLARYGDIDLRHIEPRAFWEDLKNVGLIKYVTKCAVVAEQDWVRRVTDAASHVLPCELRSFPLDEYAEARAWIES